MPAKRDSRRDVEYLTDEEAQAIEEENERQRLRRAREVDDFRWVAAHPQGRRFLWRLLEGAGVFQQTYTGNSETFFKEGRRSMGLFVLGEIMEIVPDTFVKMLKENESNERSDRSNRAG